jgi:O-antigen/teichoic acid export membrane protein
MVLPAMTRPISSRSNVLWYLVPRLLSRLSALFLLPIYTRVLGPDELGAALVAIAAAGALGFAVAPGIEAVYLRWVYRRDDPTGRVVGTVTVVHLAMLGIALAVLTLLATPVADFLLPGVPRSFYVLILASTICASLTSPLRAEWRATRRINRLAGAELIQAVVSAATVLVLLLGFHAGAISLLAGEVAGSFVLVPLAVGRVAANVRRGWDATTARHVLPLAVSGIPVSLSIWGLASLDRILLNRLSGPASVAMYGVAYQMAAALMFVSIILDKEWEVLVFEHHRDATAPAASLQHLWSLSLSLFLVMAAALAVSAHDVMRFWAGPSYVAAAPLVPWLLIVAVLKVPYSFFIHLARATNHTAAVTGGTVLSIAVFAVANLWLIPVWGIYGAAAAGIMAYLAACLLWSSQSWNTFRLEPATIAMGLLTIGTVLLTTRFGGTFLDRVLLVPFALLGIQRAIGYWRFLGRLAPAGLAV